MTRPRRPSPPGLPVWWWCLDCPSKGEGDREAQRHTDDTRHSTMTTIRPPKENP